MPHCHEGSGAHLAHETRNSQPVCGRIEATLDWAKVRGFRAGENPARRREHPRS